MENLTEQQLKARAALYEEADMRAESTPFAKAHLKIKSSKGKFKSNQQPPKKKRKNR